MTMAVKLETKVYDIFRGFPKPNLLAIFVLKQLHFGNLIPLLHPRAFVYSKFPFSFVKPLFLFFFFPGVKLLFKFTLLGSRIFYMHYTSIPIGDMSLSDIYFWQSFGFFFFLEVDWSLSQLALIQQKLGNRRLLLIKLLSIRTKWGISVSVQHLSMVGNRRFWWLHKSFLHLLYMSYFVSNFDSMNGIEPISSQVQ